jgi:hypothetical protein
VVGLGQRCSATRSTLAIVGTLLVLFIVDSTIGLRVRAEDEGIGPTLSSMEKKDTSGRMEVDCAQRFAEVYSLGLPIWRTGGGKMQQGTMLELREGE